MSKLFRWASWAGILVLALAVMLGGTTEAARRSPVHELNYLHTEEIEIDGRQALRIEIGMNKPNLEYEVTTKPYLRKQLILNLKNTKIGKIDKRLDLDSELATSVRLTETEPKNTEIKIDFVGAVEDGSYDVHIEEAERHARRPYRLVIDIFMPLPQVDNTIDGVKGRTIVLDAGHGGSDRGASGPSGLTEKSVTLAVTQKVQNILESSGANVVMTRTTDVDVYGPGASDKQELQARCNVANRTPGAELFVSIHCNAFASSAAHGMETYYYAASAEGKRLATLLNEELVAAGGLFNRGVKTANFYVMKHTNMPASLIELGFITNYSEERLLGSDEYQTKLATAVATAIARFFTR